MDMKFGMGTNYVVKGFGAMSFQMESGCTLRVQDVLWVLELKVSVISVSMIDKKGFDIEL
jgi:hypothetical protein